MNKTRQFLSSPGIFRLFLALTVVFGHITRIDSGKWAVNVFFVLSGYWVALMYRNKYSKLKNPLLAFYVSRFWRLFPVYAFCQSLAIVYYLSIPDSDIRNFAITPVWLVRAFSILGNGSQPLIISPAWSLDVEAQFYLIVPFIVGILTLATDKWKGRVALIFAIALLPLSWQGSSSTIPFLPANLAFFLFGISNTYSRWSPSPKVAYSSIALFFTLITFLFIQHSTRPIILKSDSVDLIFAKNLLSSFLSILILPYVFYSFTIRSSNLDKDFGNLSYPLYLFHWLPFLYFRHQYGVLSLKEQPVIICLEVSVMMIGSLAIYWLVDRPLDNKRAAFVKRHFSEV